MVGALLSRRGVAGALGIAGVLGVLLAPALARAQDGRDVTGRPLLADQFFGLMIRVGGGGFAGENASKLAQPEFGYGGSLQIRLLESIYLEVSGDSRMPLSARAPEGGYLMTIDRQTVGLRARLPSGSGRVVFGAGGGAVRATFVEQEVSFNGPAAAVFGGYEWEIAGTNANGAYAGVEAVWTHYFLQEDAPFRGGHPEVRATFSYYFGGEEAADCW